MITILGFVKSQVGKGIVNTDHWDNVNSILDVKVHEAIMTFDAEVG